MKRALSIDHVSKEQGSTLADNLIFSININSNQKENSKMQSKFDNIDNII